MYADLKNRSGAITRIAPSTKAALLLEDATLLEECQRDFDSTVGAEEYGLSLHKADYVNWTHSMPHNISYGVGHLHRALFVSSVLAQTPLDFNGPKRYNMFNLVRYCFEPAMYRSQGFVMFSGRSTFAIELNYGASILAKTIPMIGCFGEEEDAYIKRFIKRHAASAEVQERVKAECSIYDCATLNSILNDDTIPSDNSSYEIGYAWFTGDRAAQHRKDYAVGIAMSSRREKAYECINSANKTGWYTGNGAIYLYTNYDTHQYDGKNFITNNINVAYHFPGTTEDSRPRVIRSISSTDSWYPDNAFAGGVQVGGKYVVAAMDYISMNNEVDEYPDDYGYGGSQPIHLNDLRARKAWFCFDDEIVCLGAGITSTMSSPVNTTAEHRRIVNAEGDKQYMNGELLPTSEYEKRYTGRPYFNMEGHAGYVFLEDTDVYLRRYVCEDAAGQSFIELRAEHGENPTDKTYAYAVLPYATNDVLSEYRNNPDVRIISNTAKCQAVKDASSGVWGYVFYEAGECDGIEVSGPCIVTKHREGNEWVLGVCDATQKQRTLTVTLNEKITVTGKNAKITASEKDGKTLLTVNVFVAHGRRFEIKYN